MKPSQEAIDRRKYYLSGLKSTALNIKPKKSPTRKRLKIVSNNPQTLKAALQQDARSFEPLTIQASAGYTYTQGYPYQGTKPAGGRTYAGLTEYAPVTIIDHYPARAQARRIDKESVEARAMLKRNNSYVVGKGLVLDPEPDFKTIGVTQERAAKWSARQKSRFHLWAKSKDSDITGTNNFYQNMRLAHRMKDRDGEAFVRFHYSDNPELLNPLQISFIDPNQIRGDELTFSTGPESQDDGINKDANGKPVSYKVWIIDHEKTGNYKDITIPAFDDSGRPLMLHLFEPEYAGQTRGIPKINHAIQDFEQITGYNTAALTRMENGATFNFTSENEQQDPSDFDLSQLNRQSAGLETKTTETPATPTVIGSETAYCTGIPEARLNETGVNIFGGRKGDTLKATPDLSPGETAQVFTDNRFEKIAASMNISPEVALMKTSTSFTAAKGAFGMQDLEAKIDRADLEADLVNIAVMAWTSEEIAAGRTRAPGWSDPIIRAAWLKSKWIAPPPIDLKPSDTAKANQINAELGLVDLDTAAEQLNNSDGQSNRSKLKKQIAELTPFPVQEQKQTNQPPPDQDDGNEDEE